MTIITGIFGLLIVMAWCGILILLGAAIGFAIIDLVRRRRAPTDYPSENGDGEDR